MPDTPKNQNEYRPALQPEAWLRLSRLRDIVVLTLPGRTGAALDLATARWSGKLTGENALLRGLRDRLTRGSNLRLADSY